ncbi:hypothetical protein MCETHM1_02704 [Flavobacteriaceae bacterium]
MTIKLIIENTDQKKCLLPNETLKNETFYESLDLLLNFNYQKIH